jgi:hypothetical protein
MLAQMKHDNSPRDLSTPEMMRAMYREAIGWDELREEIRQLIRDELSRELQTVFGSGLHKERVSADAG